MGAARRRTRGPATIHLLSKEGAGTAAPVVAALVDRILEVAELTAQAAGGRLDPPVVAVLDEAANICPIPTLPQLYSHYGSRGIQVMTMLQSYQQGVGVWGEPGHGRPLVGRHRQARRRRRRRPRLPAPPLRADRRPRRREALDQPRPRHGTAGSTPPPANRCCPSPPCARCPADRAVLLATGRRAGLGELQPWYRERDAADITAYAATALAELREPPPRRPRPRQPPQPAERTRHDRPTDIERSRDMTTPTDQLLADLAARVQPWKPGATIHADLDRRAAQRGCPPRPPTDPPRSDDEADDEARPRRLIAWVHATSPP